MNLNQAYFDHQLSLMRADGADTPCLEHRHQREAADIADRIGQRQDELGAPAATSWARHSWEQSA